MVKLDDATTTRRDGFTLPAAVHLDAAAARPRPPDLLVLATELAGVGGIDLPLEVSAIDSFASVTDAPERSLSIVVAHPRRARPRCTSATRRRSAPPWCKCKDISLWLLERADSWLGED